MEKRDYDLVYEPELKEVSDYKMNEEEYLDYCQNSNDPTCENYNFKRLKMVDSNRISYYKTVLRLFRQGKKLSILTRQDFLQFMRFLVLSDGWKCSHIRFSKNNGVSLITTGKIDYLGDIKCLWIIKKSASHRAIGVKVIRNLKYLIQKMDATKGIIVTTSKFTNEAKRFIKRERFIISAIDSEMLEKKILNLKVTYHFLDEL
jgi:hypothetical protein